MKKQLLILFTFISILTLISCKKEEILYPQWSILQSGIDKEITSIYFINNTTGFAVSWGIILKTTNGGLNWQNIDCPTSTGLNSIFFLNEKYGFISGHNGSIIKTTDGGNSWRYYSTGTLSDLESIFFVDEMIGYVVGSDFMPTKGVVLKTIDGGINWAMLNPDIDCYLNSVYFTDSNTGYAVGNKGNIIKTSDGGNTWIKLVNETDNVFRTISFINENVGFVGGGTTSDGYGICLKTENKGETWTSISTPSRHITSFYFQDNYNGYATSYDNSLNGLLLKTVDGGLSWTVQKSDIEFNGIYCSSFPSPNIGFLAGISGTIVKFENNK
jgi:photosystem II stability/assembly factor-like uncharacterized protein